MKAVFRIAVLSIFIFCASNLFAQKRDAGDTLLLKRPRYFGFFVGRLQLMQAEHFLYNSEHSLDIGTQVLQLKVGDAIQGGLFFTYPFLHKMEWDAGFGVFSFKRQTRLENVTAISSGATPQIISSYSWNDNRNLVVTEVRSYFSYDLIQNDNYSILIGAGGWLASNRMKAEFNPGSVGVEGCFTGYYRYSKKSFVQIHLAPGWMKNGYYINFGIAICYQGERTMRAHPPHYYVRTYDQED